MAFIHWPLKSNSKCLHRTHRCATNNQYSSSTRLTTQSKSLNSPNNMVSILYALLFMAISRLTNADIFESLADVKVALQAEKKLVQHLNKYIAAEAIRLKDVQEIVNDMEHKNQQYQQHTEENLSNVVTAFKTATRLTKIWKEKKKAIFSSQLKSQYETVLKKVTKKFPEEQDLISVAESMFRIQDVYGLHVEEFVNGSLGVNSDVMSAKDCFHVGEVALMNKDFYHSAMWMEYSYKMVVTNKDASIELSQVLEHLTSVLHKAKLPEHLPRAVKLCEQWVLIDPQNINAKNKLKLYKKDLKSVTSKQIMKCSKKKTCVASVERSMNKTEPFIKRVRQKWEGGKVVYEIYETLCRGKNVYESKDLYCSFRRYNPIHVLLPLKEEILMRDPFVALYHDFLSEGEVEHLKRKAEPEMSKSGTINGVEDFRVRKSQTAWLPDSMSATITRLTQRAVAIGNLSTGSTDAFQVVRYGFGGHYTPHNDWTDESNFSPEFGNRLATVLLYLTDVPRGGGGHTVFMGLGVRVTREKGAALFWWNLKRNTDGDQRMGHAGCPVIHGSKWIANKWVHVREQLFTRPCLLDPRM